MMTDDDEGYHHHPFYNYPQILPPILFSTLIHVDSVAPVLSLAVIVQLFTCRSWLKKQTFPESCIVPLPGNLEILIL